MNHSNGIMPHADEVNLQLNLVTSVTEKYNVEFDKLRKRHQGELQIKDEFSASDKSMCVTNQLHFQGKI